MIDEWVWRSIDILDESNDDSQMDRVPLLSFIILNMLTNHDAFNVNHESSETKQLCFSSKDEQVWVDEMALLIGYHRIFKRMEYCVWRHSQSESLYKHNTTIELPDAEGERTLYESLSSSGCFYWQLCVFSWFGVLCSLLKWKETNKCDAILERKSLFVYEGICRPIDTWIDRVLILWWTHSFHSMTLFIKQIVSIQKSITILIRVPKRWEGCIDKKK